MQETLRWNGCLVVDSFAAGKRFSYDGVDYSAQRDQDFTRRSERWDQERQSVVTLLVNQMAYSGQSKSSGHYVNVLPGLA